METIMYHKMFNEIKPEAVAEVKCAIKSGLFKKDKQIGERFEILKSLHTKLCGIFSIEVIPLLLDAECIGVGAYNPYEHEIVVNKVSLVTYLHEFYHYLAHATALENTEDNARGWSISLYYLATPILCEKAILSGKILHQTSMGN